jgi:hypothetical protein
MHHADQQYAHLRVAGNHLWQRAHQVKLPLARNDVANHTHHEIAGRQPQLRSNCLTRPFIGHDEPRRIYEPMHSADARRGHEVASDVVQARLLRHGNDMVCHPPVEVECMGVRAQHGGHFRQTAKPHSKVVRA